MTHARKYFRNELSSYFMWADHGRELCWCNGMTIAFHEEISAVLERLGEQNFPDFSTLALTLATMRESWPEVAAQLAHAFTLLKLSQHPLIRTANETRKEAMETWPGSLVKLTLLRRYVETHSPLIRERADLVDLVLEDFQSSFAESTQRELVAAFQAGLPDDWLEVDDRHADVDALLLPVSVIDGLRMSDSKAATEIAVPRILRMLRIVNSVAALIPCTTVDQLHQLLHTGIADDVRPPQEPLLDQRAQARGLLEELSDDEEFSGFARVTKQLIAAITLPRSLSEPDDLQMGGISDISNRGSLDSLLLSELAHDDLTLAVRLAMNEALYMRRESPPSPQTRTRSVLIDLSLPMWGIPRLYATAAAMALHATSDEQIRINCFRSSLTGMMATKLTTREGLQEHMSALEPTEHPGASLQSFFEAILGEQPLSAEPVLITTSDVLESSEFRQTLDKTCIGDIWLIVVERDGRLKVLQRTRQGTSVRKQLQLPLDEILSRRTAEKMRRTDRPHDLPAIFHLAKFPLLLSHQTRIGRFWKWGESAIAVTDDGRLMHWTEKGLGARQLATGLSGRGDAKIFILRRQAGGFLQLLICPMNEQVGTLVTVSGMNDDVTIQRADYRVPIVSDIVVTEPALLVFGRTHEGLEVCSAMVHDSGEFLGTHPLGHDISARTGRCLLHNVIGCCVLNWVGGHASWLLQALPEFPQHIAVVIGAGAATSFVAETTPGAYVAIWSNQLVDPLNKGRFRHWNAELLDEGEIYLQTFLEVSIDGDLAVVSHLVRDEAAKMRGPRDAIGHTVIDLRSERVIASSNEPSTGSEIARIEYERAFPFVRQRTSHYRFSRIGTDSGRLVLQDPGGGLFHVAWDSTNRAIRLEPAGEMAALPQLVEFVEMPTVSGFTFQKAEWDNGSKAWLDSRGLLHLRSAKRTNPEITLVMRDGPLSGWLSSGEVFGDNYTCGKDPFAHGLRRVTADFAWNSAIRLFIESVPWNFHFSSDTAQTGNTVLPGY